MVKRLTELPTYHEAMTDEDYMCDEKEQLAPRRNSLKSGTHRTRVVRKVTKSLPHEVVYTSVGKPASYQDISISSFLQGYLIIMESEDSTTRQRMAAHLKELMSDAGLLG